MKWDLIKRILVNNLKMKLVKFYRPQILNKYSKIFHKLTVLIWICKFPLWIVKKLNKMMFLTQKKICIFNNSLRAIVVRKKSQKISFCNKFKIWKLNNFLKIYLKIVKKIKLVIMILNPITKNLVNNCLKRNFL